MILYFLEHIKINGIFNVGFGIARSWNDLANAVFGALNRKPQIDYIDMPATIRDQYQYFTELKINKIRLAGYGKSLMSLEDAAKDYVQNYLVSGDYLDH